MSGTAFSLEPRARRLVRGRRVRRAAWGTVFLLLAAWIAARLLGLAGGPGDHEQFHQRRAEVLEVLEGNLIRVSLPQGPVAVRLIGVDTHGRAEARSRTAQLCGEGVLLYLEMVPTRNRSGELLAYVWAADVLVNQALIEEGLGWADRRWEFTYFQTFTQAEEQAFVRRRGLWEALDDSQMPEWRQRWLAEMRKEPWERREWRRADEP